VASSMTFDEAAALRVEALYATPDVAATRVAAFRALDPRPGERIADLGCGPGFMTRELALAVGPSGRVHGLDLSAPMLALARARCAGLPAVELAEGDMAAVGLPDGSLDAAVALQSLEYVPEVARAVAEVARLLRPGGRAVVLDTDFGSVVWHGRDQARVDRILAAYDAHVAHRGLPRVLGRLATEAGLAVVRREVVPILDASFHPNTYAHGIALFIRDFVVGSGRVPAEEADGWLAECTALDAAGEFFMGLNRYLFVLRKPG
jgi:arsenite methyltransferase